MKMLLRNCMSRLREAFLKWKNVAKIMDIEEKMVNNEKTFMIEKLERFAMQKDKFALAEVLRLFRLNAKKSENVKRLHKMLLNTKIGKALELFKKWKNLPEKPKDDMLGRAANDLERKLAHHAKKALKSGFDPLKDENNLAENKQKNILKNWIYLTMDKRTRMFLGWKHYSEKCKDAEKFQNLLNLANNLQDVINSNINPLMNEPPTGVDKREEIMKMLLRNCMSRLREAFLKWKNVAKIMEIEDKMANKEKTFMIEKLERFAMQQDKFALAEVLRLFRLNAKKSENVKRLHKMLLNTKIGKALELFKKWKNLPEKPKDDMLGRAANDLERKLAHHAKKALKSGFDPLKDEKNAGENKQKDILKNWIYLTMDKRTRMFLGWKHYSEKCKDAEKFQNIFNLANNLQDVINSNVNPLMNEPPTGVDKREEIMKMLLRNCMSRLREAFLKWKNVAKIMEIEDKMANKEKTFVIEKLERFAMQKDKFALAEVLRLFRLNAKKSENVKRLHKMLLNTKIGKALELFKKWKNLPEKPKDDMLGRAANDLERKLAHHAKKALKSGFDPLKDEKNAGETKQKDILKNWIYLTMDKRTRMFFSWKHFTEKCKDAEKFQNIFNLANNLQDVINSNINPLMNEPPTGVDKREEIMKMLLRNCMSRLREAFLKWKNVAKIMEIEDKMANKEKTFVIEKLERFAMQKDKFALAEVLRLFRLNAKKSENVKRLHKMLLNTKIGKALELFKKWKNLPEKPKDDMLGRAANDLERKLAHHAKKALKSGFDPLKDEKNAGETKQKDILKNWIYLTMDKRTRMFFSWKHFTEKCKDAEKFQNIFNLANNLQDVINSNINPLMNALLLITSCKLFAKFNKFWNFSASLHFSE